LKEAKARRRRAIKQFLIVALCFVILLCLGGIAAGFFYYDRATKPDLSSPVLVTHRYISAYLIDRDDRAAERYQCANPSGLAEFRALRDDIDNRQKTYGVSISASVDSVQDQGATGNAETLAVDLILTAVIQGKPQRDLEHWSFTARNEDGWRVCGAHELD
jgi:hypothetical protein